MGDLGGGQGTQGMGWGSPRGYGHLGRAPWAGEGMGETPRGGPEASCIRVRVKPPMGRLMVMVKP